MFADIAPRVGGVFLNQQDRTLAAEKANPLCTGDFLRSWHPGKVVDLLLADIPAAVVCIMATESVPCPASSPFSMASNSQSSVRTSRICCLDTKGLLEPNRATTDLTRSRACRAPNVPTTGKRPAVHRATVITAHQSAWVRTDLWLPPQGLAACEHQLVQEVACLKDTCVDAAFVLQNSTRIVGAFHAISHFEESGWPPPCQGQGTRC